MSITEKYFSFSNSSDIQKFLDKTVFSIGRKHKLEDLEEISRAMIYDSDKVRTVHFMGYFEGSKIILKINLLEPDIDELDIILQFKEVSRSKRIKLPEVFAAQRWDSEKGYGYIVEEYIEGEKIYNGGLMSEEEVSNYLDFFQDYKENVTSKPFFHTDGVSIALHLALTRVVNWYQIALEKDTLNKEINNFYRNYLTIIAKKLSDVPVSFIHARLTSNYVLKKDNNYYLVANCLWGFRPKYYEASFHIWDSLLTNKDYTKSSHDVWNYIMRWETKYRQTVYKNDYQFENGFYVMLLERCIGALLIDIHNVKDITDQEKEYLINLFTDIFSKCYEKILKI